MIFGWPMPRQPAGRLRYRPGDGPCGLIAVRCAVNGSNALDFDLLAHPQLAGMPLDGTLLEDPTVNANNPLECL
jgi:hypothetical protein